jgi:hypothetical protein
MFSHCKSPHLNLPRGKLAFRKILQVETLEEWKQMSLLNTSTTKEVMDLKKVSKAIRDIIALCLLKLLSKTK